MITKRAVLAVLISFAVGGVFSPVHGEQTVRPVQLAQASAVTKFRGFFLGMNAAELDAAIGNIGAQKEKFTDIFSNKIDPSKFNVKKDGKLLAFILLDEGGHVLEMRLENDFFEIPGPVPLREFAEKLAKAYGVPRFRYERTTNILGSFWSYIGETQSGERLMVVDYMGTQEPSVEVSKAKSGAF